MSRSTALTNLNLASQDWGPCYADEWTHAEFSEKWRGTTACPSEAELLAAWEPAPHITTSCTPLEFIERFTDAEQLAIVTAAMQNPALRLWYDKLMAAQEVVFTDPRLSAGLDAMVEAGLLTAERKAEVLA